MKDFKAINIKAFIKDFYKVKLITKKVLNYIIIN